MSQQDKFFAEAKLSTPAEVPTAVSPVRSVSRGVYVRTAIAVGIVTLTVFGAILYLRPEKEVQANAPTPSREPLTHTPDRAKSAALKFAEQHITANLKNPSTAKYPAEEMESALLDEATRRDGSKIGEWGVSGRVDSQNDYGVTVGAKWLMTLYAAANGTFELGGVYCESRLIFKSALEKEIDEVKADGLSKSAKILKEPPNYSTGPSTNTVPTLRPRRKPGAAE